MKNGLKGGSFVGPQSVAVPRTIVREAEERRESGRWLLKGSWEGSLACAGTEGNKTNYKSKVNAE